jgi:hypothetical protein
MTDLTGRSKKPSHPQWGKALTLIDAQNELGPLKTVVDVERWLDRMPKMARVGRLRSQYVTGRLLDAVHAWCRNHQRQVSGATMQALERRVAALQTTMGRPASSAAPVKPGKIANPAKAARGGVDLRNRHRRRLADRRSGTECRSGDDRRGVARRRRDSNGRRSGNDRRTGSAMRRSGIERRRLSDRRGLAP